MSELLLQTKLAPPLIHQKMVPLVQLLAQLNKALLHAGYFTRKLTLRADSAICNPLIIWFADTVEPFAIVLGDQLAKGRIIFFYTFK